VTEIDPTTLTPARGHAIAEIVEVLGGERNGVFVPGEDHMRKDTAMVQILKMGEPPMSFHHQPDYTKRPEMKEGSAPWPKGYPGFSEGDVVCIPRDVPKAFAHDGKRYAIILMSDVLFKSPPDLDVRVIPWDAQNTHGGHTQTYHINQR
jgi:hypothetical protein